MKVSRCRVQQEAHANDSFRARAVAYILRFYRKSIPTPMENPRARRSPCRATSGIEKLSSIRSGSKRYMSPMPADTLGIDTILDTLSTNERSGVSLQCSTKAAKMQMQK